MQILCVGSLLGCWNSGLGVLSRRLLESQVFRKNMQMNEPYAQITCRFVFLTEIKLTQYI